MKVGDLVQDISDRHGSIGIIVGVINDGVNIHGAKILKIFKVRWSDSRLGFFYENELVLLNELEE